MICSHKYLGIPHTNYLWCTYCGSLRDNSTTSMWTPEIHTHITQDHQGLTEEERKYCALDQKIHAIKCVRGRTGMGLKEAKDVVEAYMSKNPPKPANLLISHCEKCAKPFTFAGCDDGDTYNNSGYVSRYANTDYCYNCNPDIPM